MWKITNQAAIFVPAFQTLIFLVCKGGLYFGVLKEKRLILLCRESGISKEQNKKWYSPI